MDSGGCVESTYKTHDVASSRGSAVCTDNYTAVKLDGHDGSLSTGSNRSDAGTSRSGGATYAEVDLASFEPVHVDSFHSQKMMSWMRGADEGCSKYKCVSGRLRVLVLVKNARRVRVSTGTSPRLARITQTCPELIMSSSKLHTLYKQLVRAFTSHPADMKTSGRLLADLKVRFGRAHLPRLSLTRVPSVR